MLSTPSPSPRLAPAPVARRRCAPSSRWRWRALPARPWCAPPTRCCRRSPRTSRITVGAASIVITAYALTHGSMQFVTGPIADRFGKYRTVAIACALSAVTVALCGLAQLARQPDARPLRLRHHGRLDPADQPRLSSATWCPTSSASRCSAASSPARCWPAVRPGRRRHHRRLFRLAHHVLPARGDARARRRGARHELATNPITPRAIASAPKGRGLDGELQDRAAATRGRASCCWPSASKARCSRACSHTSAPTCICASG